MAQLRAAHSVYLRFALLIMLAGIRCRTTSSYSGA
jgi:hypothetical protein